MCTREAIIMVILVHLGLKLKLPGLVASELNRDLPQPTECWDEKHVCATMPGPPLSYLDGPFHLIFETEALTEHGV